MRVVTSMSLRGFESYGKAFLAGYKGCCRLPLTVYSEDDLPIDHTDLRQQPEYLAFRETAPGGPDYRYDADRFCHKVFAVTDPAIREHKHLLWLDADVEFLKEWDTEFLGKVTPPDVMGSYLGRHEMPTSECGWVFYNLAQGAGRFLDRFREVYTSGEIYDHLEWHDSFIFDRVREEIGGEWLNISEGVPGMHVWDDCILGQYMKHLKGPVRKAGGAPGNGQLPKEYWSTAELIA